MLDIFRELEECTILKLTRIACGMTTYQMSELSGLSRPTIQRVEEGKRVHPGSMKKYTAALGQRGGDN